VHSVHILQGHYSCYYGLEVLPRYFFYVGFFIVTILFLVCNFMVSLSCICTVFLLNLYSCKVIQMNQLDSTMVYWSIRSAQHVSGNILPIIRSVKLRYLQHMVSCCCGEQGDGSGSVAHSATLPLTVSLPTTTTGYHML